MPPDPDPIVNGSDAGVCDWPAAVSIINTSGDHFCTGVLVHPRVVLLAAHCIDPFGAGHVAQSVVWGENSYAPSISAGVESCAMHPSFDNDTNIFDLAYCVLSEDAPDVPIVPVIMGCEVDALVPDAEVTIVGYGVDDEAGFGGTGTKRFTTQVVEELIEETNDLLVLGSDGSSACFGDSGGPSYIQLEDGSWRVAGVTSAAHPSTMGMPLICGTGVVYDLIHPEMEWLETATALDLTPCHDADGTWNPSEGCDEFPMTLAFQQTTWPDLCATPELSEPSATCGDPFDVEGTGTGTGTGTTGGEESSSSGEAGTAESTTGIDPTSADDTTTTGDASDGSSTSGVPQDDAQSDGCGCTSRAVPSSMWLLSTLVLFRRRRRGVV